MNLFLAGSSNSQEVKFPKDLLFEGNSTSLLERDSLCSRVIHLYNLGRVEMYQILW